MQIYWSKLLVVLELDLSPIKRLSNLRLVKIWAFNQGHEFLFYSCNVIPIVSCYFSLHCNYL